MSRPDPAPRGLLHALFFISGFAALGYEVVWTRQLVLVFGATVQSVSTVLAAFMAGSALGALLGARWCRRAGDPLAVYGKLELGIAALAAAWPLEIQGILAFVEASDLPIAPLRFALTFTALLPPTILMGATFPVLAQAAGSGDAGRDAGDLYAANLFGACLGALVNAFVVLAFLGLRGTYWLAVLLNLAAGTWALRRAGSGGPPRAAVAPFSPAPDGTQRAAMACVFVSGLCGMASEVIWTRLLIPSFSSSVYCFAAVLAVFLAGLGLGSVLAGRLPARGVGPLGGLLVLSALVGFVGYLSLELTQLFQVYIADMSSPDQRPPLLIPLVETCLVLGPFALLQGTILPTGVRLCAPGAAVGAVVGRLYFWNTLGAIAGSLAAGFWWLPAFNVQGALLITLGLAGAFGSALIVASAPRPWVRAAVPACALLAVVLGRTRLAGRHLPLQFRLEWDARYPELNSRMIYYAEDAEASVGVLARGSQRLLLVNGIGVTSYTNATKMMAHIPLLLHPDPQRTLIICFGMGTTFRSALSHPGSVDVVELVPAVLKAFPHSYSDAGRWTSDPRASLIVNDGRNHLLRDRGGYDVVIVDPSPPLFAAGTANLYNRDFFRLARCRLRPGGLLAVWLLSTPRTEFEMVMKSFLEVWPHVSVWRTTAGLRGVLMLGSESPIPADRRRVAARLRLPEVRRDMLELDREFEREDAFWRLYRGTGEWYRERLAGVRSVTDDFPWIEYPYFRSWSPAYRQRSKLLDRPPAPFP